MVVVNNLECGRKMAAGNVVVNRGRKEVVVGYQRYELFVEGQHYCFRIGTKKYEIPSEFNANINPTAGDVAIGLDFY